MAISCVVDGCTNRFATGSGLRFHRIPTESERRMKWLQSINRKKWTPDHSGDRVCGAHFISGTASNDPADPDFIPHINMGYKSTSLATAEAKKDRFSRIQRREAEKRRWGKELKDKQDAALVLMELSNTVFRTDDVGVEIEENESDIHDPLTENNHEAPTREKTTPG